LPSLYSADEVVMIVREPLRSNPAPNANARKGGAASRRER